jgi:hypothetical protein
MFAARVDGWYGIAVCVDVFYMLPVTILHEEVTYVKQRSQGVAWDVGVSSFVLEFISSVILLH